MGLTADSRNETKLKAIRRAEFALRQRLERIDWDFDELRPEIAEFKAKAQMPELPAEQIVEIFEDIEEEQNAQDTDK